MSDVTDDELQRWERLCEAATEGPWRECRADDGGCICGMVYALPCDTHIATAEGMHNEEKPVPTEVQRKNATFIAESRTALPRLIAAYREALAELERLRAGRDDDYVSPPLPIVRTVKCRITHGGPLPTPTYRDDDDDVPDVRYDINPTTGDQP